MLLEQSNPAFNLNLQDSQTKQAAILLDCPVNKNLVAADDWKQILIANEPGIWWHCPKCRSWHIMLKKR